MPAKSTRKSSRPSSWERLQILLAEYYVSPDDPKKRDAAFVAVHECISELARQVVRAHPANRLRVTPLTDRLAADFWRKRTFTDLVRKEYRPSAGARFSTWCRRVLANQLTDWYRKHRAELESLHFTIANEEELAEEWRLAVHDVADFDLLDHANRSLESLVDLRLQTARLPQEIDKLPADLRRVIVGFRDDEATNSQSAANLGISVATYKRKYAQALLRLKVALLGSDSIAEGDGAAS